MGQESTQEAIGQRLRELRGELTQTEFADKMGVVSKTVRRYETGETLPDGAFLLRLKTIFNADPTWVLLGEPALPQKVPPVDQHKDMLENYQDAISSITEIIANLEKGKR